MKKAFFEPDCDIGGYSCPAWSDAYEKLRDPGKRVETVSGAQKCTETMTTNT